MIIISKSQRVKHRHHWLLSETTDNEESDTEIEMTNKRKMRSFQSRTSKQQQSQGNNNNNNGQQQQYPIQQTQPKCGLEKKENLNVP